MKSADSEAQGIVLCGFDLQRLQTGNQRRDAEGERQGNATTTPQQAGTAAGRLLGRELLDSRRPVL